MILMEVLWSVSAWTRTLKQENFIHKNISLRIFKEDNFNSILLVANVDQIFLRLE